MGGDGSEDFPELFQQATAPSSDKISSPFGDGSLLGVLENRRGAVSRTEVSFGMNRVGILRRVGPLALGWPPASQRVLRKFSSEQIERAPVFGKRH